MRINFSENLKSLRLQHNLMQKDLADKKKQQDALVGTAPVDQE